MSILRGNLPEESLVSLRKLMERLHMPISVEGIDLEKVIEDTKNDKKMDGNSIRFILLHHIGEAFIEKGVTEEEMRAGLLTVLQ